MIENKDKAQALEDALASVSQCHKCILADTRTHVVAGAGDPCAQVMFIGEAPGKNEDMKGEPFIGAAGSLLDSLLNRIGLSRGDIYIANILKCRPPRNRDPHPDEIEQCTPWLTRQVEIVDPRILVTMGNFASQFILQTREGITNLRGTVCEKEGRLVFPVFHPAAAIYDRKKIEVLESDFDQLKELLAQETNTQTQA